MTEQETIFYIQLLEKSQIKATSKLCQSDLSGKQLDEAFDAVIKIQDEIASYEKLLKGAN